MNRHQARSILIRFRPGIDDEQEPAVAEALDQLRTDPELARWFEQHHAWQAVVRQKMRELPAPASLKERILAATPARRIIPFWRRRTSLAWAALMALGLGLLFFRMAVSRTPGFDEYRERMVRTALRDYRMNMVSADHDQIRQFLRTNSPHGDYLLPEPLRRLPGAGAALLTWQSKPVSLICLDASDRTLFLFVANQTDIFAAPDPARPVFQRVNKMTTATWQQSGKIYLLAGEGDPEWLARFVP